jgi:outer membrane lipoprotein-sorting protein
MEDYVAELKAEAEASVMKTLEKILSDKEEFVGMDKSYWTSVIYKMSENDATITKLRGDNMKLRKKIKDMESE